MKAFHRQVRRPPRETTALMRSRALRRPARRRRGCSRRNIQSDISRISFARGAIWSRHEAMAEKIDVENILPIDGLFLSEKIEEQSADAHFFCSALAT